MSTFTLTQIDDDGGAAVTHVLHRINAGTAVATPIAPLPQTVDIAAQSGDSVQIALRNAIGDGPWSASLTFVEVISTSLSLTSGVTGIALDLDAIQPPNADPTTWAHTLIAPGTGQTLVDPTYTLSNIGTDILTGTYTVRRTVDGGALQNLAFAVTVVEPSLTVLNGSATLVVGADDPATESYSLTASDPGGPFDGVAVTVSRADLNAIEPAPGMDPTRVLFATTGVIALQTDVDSDGLIEEGDTVHVVLPPLPVQWSGPDVPITSEWYLDGVPTGLTAETYTVPPGASGTITRAWTDGVTTVFSNALTISAVAGVAVTQVVAPLANNVTGLNTTTAITRSVDLSQVPVGDELLLLFHYHTNGETGGIGTVTLGGVDVPSLTVNAKNARTVSGVFAGCEFRRIARPDVGGGIMDLVVRGSNLSNEGSTSPHLSTIYHIQGRGSDVDVVGSNSNYGPSSGTLSTVIPVVAGGAVIALTASQADVAGSYTTGIDTQAVTSTGTETYHIGHAAIAADGSRTVDFQSGAAAGRTSVLLLSLAPAT